MILSSRQLATTLLGLLSSGSSPRDLGEKTVSFLRRKKKLALLAPVLQEIKKMQLEKDNKCEIRITSAFLLSDELKKEAEKKAQELFLEKEIQCSYAVDSSLQGGIIIASDERRWDASVQTSLQALRKSL